MNTLFKLIDKMLFAPPVKPIGPTGIRSTVFPTGLRLPHRYPINALEYVKERSKATLVNESGSKLVGEAEV